LAFAGSLRKESYNKKLVKIAIEGAEKGGAQVTYIDLKDYPLPLYDQDYEEISGIPENALKLKVLMSQSDGFIIASPEYNGSFSAALKNMIDWTSRKASEEEKNLSCFVDKWALLLSASPSELGGSRGLVHLRALLTSIYMFVMPKQKCIGRAYEAFDENGQLKKEEDQKSVQALAKQFAEMVQKIKK
jgi:NAD(P)H-dependent FMN reductase